MSIARYLFPALIFLVFSSDAAGQPLPVPSATPYYSFEQFLELRSKKSDSEWTMEKFCAVQKDVVASRVLREYGAIFSATESVAVPNSCLYSTEADVLRFQNSVSKTGVDVSGVNVTLQAKAAESLAKAITEAAGSRLKITAYDGPIAGSRSYGDTLMLWNGRFFSALDYWIKRGRLSELDREAVSKVDLTKRIEMILNWESQGIYFSTDRSRSIFSSVAPPGASQHLSMLAFDVAEYSRPEIRDILQRNGWYQTVVGDPVHFTFLGVAEAELPKRGLRLVQRGSTRYWVPNLVTITR